MKTNVLLLMPPLVRENPETRRGRDSYRTRYPHMGLAYMAAILKRSQVPYRIIDMNLGHSLNEILSYLDRANPDFVCITVYSAGYKHVYDLVDALKAHYSGSIVLGGTHISVVKETCLAMTQADLAVVGEGENALLELVSGSRLETIKGLIWRRGSQVVSNQTREYLTDLDSLPYPAFEDFELKNYLCATDRRLPVITSRGCPFHCIYCCTPLSMGRGFRARSAENVVDELQHWYGKGWTTFDFNDDVFSFEKERAKRICELILERRLKIKFNLAVGLRANSVDRDLLQLMKEAGCRFISYGCEAGNNHVLKAIKKGIRVEDVVNAVNLTRSVGINHKVNFIIGHPMEKYGDALESIELAKSLKCNFVGFNNLIPYPGTEAYDLICKNPNARFLHTPDTYLNELTHKKMTPVFETDEFPVESMKIALRQGCDLEEKTLACFRFGKLKGYAAYVLGRNRYVSKVAHWLFDRAVSTSIGSAFYRSLVKTSW